MPDGQASFQSMYPQNIEIEIDAATIAERLLANPAFIALVAKAVRDALSKDARGVGNLYGKYAQKPVPGPGSKRRTA